MKFMATECSSNLLRLKPLVIALTVMVVVLSSDKVLAEECGNTVDNININDLFPCAPAVLNDSGSQVLPSVTCCDVVRSRGLPCLCSIYEHVRSRIPTYINLTKVKNLPKQCKITVPTGYKCGGEIIPF